MRRQVIGKNEGCSTNMKILSGERGSGRLRLGIDNDGGIFQAFRHNIWASKQNADFVESLIVPWPFKSYSYRLSLGKLWYGFNLEQTCMITGLNRLLLTVVTLTVRQKLGRN